MIFLFLNRNSWYCIFIMDIMNTFLPPFDTKKDLIELSSDWPKWKRAFEFFIETKKITDSKQKCAFLMHAGGMGLQEIFLNLPDVAPADKENDSDDEDNDDNDEDLYEQAILKLDGYFCMKRNTTVERFIFRKIRQLSGEPIDQFVVRLRTHLDRCSFGLQADEHMRDQIIEGTHSDEFREKALLKNIITLPELIELGQTLEATKLNLKNLTTHSNSETVNYVTRSKSQGGDKKDFRKKRNQTFESSNSNFSKRQKYENSGISNKKKCFRCGSENHLSFDQNCPARGKSCDRCSRIGHYKKMCRTNLTKSNTYARNDLNPLSVRHIEDEIANTTEPSDQNTSDGYLFHIGSRSMNSIKYKCILGGVPLELLIDSGSEVNVIDLKTWEGLKRQKIVVSNSKKGSEKQLRGYGSVKPLSIVGEFCTIISSSKMQTEAKFYVVKEIGQALLGRITSMELNILKIGDINSVDTSTGKIKDVIVDIPIDENVTPVSQPYRRVPIPLEHKVNRKIEDLLDQVSKIIF